MHTQNWPKMQAEPFPASLCPPVLPCEEKKLLPHQQQLQPDQYWPDWSQSTPKLFKELQELPPQPRDRFSPEFQSPSSVDNLPPIAETKHLRRRSNGAVAWRSESKQTHSVRRQSAARLRELLGRDFDICESRKTFPGFPRLACAAAASPKASSSSSSCAFFSSSSFFSSNFSCSSEAKDSAQGNSPSTSQLPNVFNFQAQELHKALGHSSPSTRACTDHTQVMAQCHAPATQLSAGESRPFHSTSSPVSPAGFCTSSSPCGKGSREISPWTAEAKMRSRSPPDQGTATPSLASPALRSLAGHHLTPLDRTASSPGNEHTCAHSVAEGSQICKPEALAQQTSTAIPLAGQAGAPSQNGAPMSRDHWAQLLSNYRQRDHWL